MQGYGRSGHYIAAQGTYTDVHTHTHTHVQYIHTYLPAYIHTYMYTYIRTYTWTQTRTHIHTQHLQRCILAQAQACNPANCAFNF